MTYIGLWGEYCDELCYNVTACVLGPSKMRAFTRMYHPV
jgi:hypothetical protein